MMTREQESTIAAMAGNHLVVHLRMLDNDIVRATVPNGMAFYISKYGYHVGFKVLKGNGWKRDPVYDQSDPFEGDDTWPSDEEINTWQEVTP